jgi:hypothetical protein
LASPALIGIPTAPTATAGTNTTQIATTAFVRSEIGAAAGGYQPLDADLTALAAAVGTNTIYYRSAANTWSAVTIGAGLSFGSGTLAATVDLSPYAPLASPTFTGDPKAPTPTAGDNDTSIATTAFVTAADALKVAKAGDAMTGALNITSNAAGTPSLKLTQNLTTGINEALNIQKQDEASGNPNSTGNGAWRFTNGVNSRFGMGAYDDGAGDKKIRMESANSFYLALGHAGTTYLKVMNLGSVVVGRGAPYSTTATDGFFYFPACAGTPTGTPAAIAGSVASIYDTIANKLWMYNGSWRSVALT